MANFEVKVYAFDQNTAPLAIAANGKIALPEKPQGQQTAIGAAINDVLRREAGKRLLGMILLSDGARGPWPPATCPRKTPPRP